MAKISVIVPVYNSEMYLKRCIDSILHQKLTDFELLCIDDGSTDNSGKILDEYLNADNRIRVFHNKNSGVSSSRNFGIDNSSASYIVFVDSDDYVDEYYLQALYNGIKDKNDLAICDMNDIYNDEFVMYNTKNDKYDYIQFTKNEEKIIAKCIENRKFNYVCDKIFSSDIIKVNDIRFDVDVSFGEDTIFVMKYFKYIDGFCLIDGHHYNYVRHSGTLATKYRPNMYDLHTAATNSIGALFADKGLLENEIIVSIDQRRTISAKWVCHALLHDMSTNKKENFKKVKHLLKEKHLKSSLKRLKKYGQLNDIQRAMNSGRVYRMRLYFGKIEGKLTIKNIVKSFLAYLHIFNR